MVYAWLFIDTGAYYKLNEFFSFFIRELHVECVSMHFAQLKYVLCKKKIFRLELCEK